MAAELIAVVKSGAVRVLDLLFLRKNPDGSVEGFESHEFGDSELGELRSAGDRARHAARRGGRRIDWSRA